VGGPIVGVGVSAGVVDGALVTMVDGTGGVSPGLAVGCGMGMDVGGIVGVDDPQPASINMSSSANAAAAARTLAPPITAQSVPRRAHPPADPDSPRFGINTWILGAMRIPAGQSGWHFGR